jgi:HK97 family phage major capsid protein
MAVITTKGFREATIGKATAINDKAINENRDLTPSEQAQFDALLGAYREATGQTVPSSREHFQAWASRPVDPVLPPGHPMGDSAGVKLYDEQGNCYRGLANKESFAAALREHPRYGVTKDQERMLGEGLTAGGFIRAHLSGPRNAVEMAALQGSSGSAGGFTVPEYLAAELIDKFRARTCMLQLGALTIPLNSDTHTFAKITGDPTAAWRHEKTTISESEPTFGAMTFRPRSLAVIVKVTRELLQDSPNIGAAIERSIAEAFALELDRVGMRGTGAAAEPLGLVNETNINAVTGAGAIADYAEILDGYKLILDDNAPDPTGVIMSNREWRTYAGLQDTTNQPMMRPKAIESLEFKATSAVPITEGGGGNESTMLMGHFPDFAFGIRANLQIELLRELFAETNEYGFVATMRVDTGAFHAESFCKITGITP